LNTSLKTTPDDSQPDFPPRKHNRKTRTNVTKYIWDDPVATILSDLKKCQERLASDCKTIDLLLTVRVYSRPSCVWGLVSAKLICGAKPRLWRAYMGSAVLPVPKISGKRWSQTAEERRLIVEETLVEGLSLDFSGKSSRNMVARS
jgi:hypothetical protein